MFNGRESATAINKTAQEQLIQAFKASLMQEEAQQAVSAHQETVFMMKEAFGNGRISLFHHFNCIDGTVYNNGAMYWFIQGVGEGLTLNMTPDRDILFATPTGAASPVPTATNMMNITSVSDIDGLVVGASTTYKPRNFMPVVPFLLKDVNKAIVNHNGSTKEVLLAAVRSIKAFDTTQAANPEYTEKAKQKCKDLVYWLYLVSQDSTGVVATPVTGCNSIDLITKLNEVGRKCLGQAGVSPTKVGVTTSTWQKKLQRPLEQLAASASSNQDILRTLTKIHESNDDKTSKSFKKIPQKYQRMILVASSQNEATVAEVNPRAAEFFKCSSTLHAKVMLNSVLEEDQLECSISNAITTMLLHGSFLWSNSVTPSGLASSIITSEDFMRSDTLHEGLVLDYSTKFEIKSSSLEKLTKTQVRFPTERNY